MSEALKGLLFTIRQHPAFSELLEQVPQPEIPRYSESRGGDPDRSHDRWVYTSGKIVQHEAWVEMLTGQMVNAVVDSPDEDE